MKTSLAMTHVAVTPGQQARVQIEVTNTSEVIDGITAIIDGINPDWVRLEQPLMSLFPDATGQVELVFDIPRECPAGDYLVVARIISTIDDDRQGVHDFWLTVNAIAGLEMSLRPRIVTGGKEGTSTATVVNTGNSSAEVTVTAVEATREIDCLIESGAVIIPQGHEALIDITMRGPRPWFGQPEARNITLTATTDDFTVEEILTFNQKPRIPRGVITFLILAAIVLLWALIFFWVITQMRADDPATKVLSPTILEGEENVPLAEIASTQPGQVTAAPTSGSGSSLLQTDTVSADPTGIGIARITVEARRVLPDGSLEPAGSVATEDDGTFQLEGLLPGTYKFRFSGDGYPTTWHGGSRKPKNATEVLLEPLQVADTINIGLAGLPGTITGSVALPEGASTDGLTAIATLAPQTGQEPFTSDPAQVQPDGTYVIEGVPTPGTYTVTVAGDNFETQQFTTTLSGGDTPQLNPVYLQPGPGTVTGSVVDENGQPLGAVEIVAQGPNIEFTTTTPTSGAVGSFTLPDLPTPATYVLTFTKDGYSGETVALDLEPGETIALGTTQLVKGIGTITGRAITQGPNGIQAVGNAPVLLLGDDVLADTTTLSEDGTFTLSGLPVPGSYSVTVGGDKFQTETVTVAFGDGATGALQIGDIVLLRATSTVGGSVLQDGAGVGELKVTLTDGIAIRETSTAINPPGRYAFADVPEGWYTLTVIEVQIDGTEKTLRVVVFEVTAGVDLLRDVNLPSGTT